MTGPSVPVLAAELAGFGPALEITGPEEAKARLARLGRDLRDLYAAAATL